MEEEAEPIDFAALAKLGIVDESAISEEDLSNDPVLAAELSIIMGDGKAPSEKRAAENLEARVNDLKREALRLKRSGDQSGALTKLREAKALEAAPAKYQDAAMNALAEIGIQSPCEELDRDNIFPSGEKIFSAQEDEEDPDLMAEMAALSNKKQVKALKPEIPLKKEAMPSSPGFELKKKALAYKRAGDIEKAMECLRQAKAIEAGDAALERVRAVKERQAGQSHDTTQLWRAFAKAIDKAMREAITDAKTRLSKGEKEAAKDVAARAHELKSILEAISTERYTKPPPAFHWIQVTAASRNIDLQVEENQAVLSFKKLRFPVEATTKITKFRLEWEFAGGDIYSKASSLVECGKTHVSAFTTEACEAITTLDAGLVSARRLLLANEAPTSIQDRRRLEAARRAVAKFGRSKLVIRIFLSVAGLFRHRESLVGTAHLRLEPLLTAAGLQDTLRIRTDPDSTLLTKPGQLDVHLRLREPLQTAHIIQAVCRNDIVIQGDVPSLEPKVAENVKEKDTSSPPGPDATQTPPKQQSSPPEAETKNPHAPTLIVSDKVLDHEIAIAEKAVSKGEDITATARRLALATTQQLLVAEVQSGKLTPATYAVRVQQRRHADLLLATWLNSHDRKSDAVRVLERIKLADTELAELREAGEID